MNKSKTSQQTIIPQKARIVTRNSQYKKMHLRM